MAVALARVDADLVVRGCCRRFEVEGEMDRFVSAAALILGVAACKAGSERKTVDTAAGVVPAPAAAPAATPAPVGTMQPDTSRGSLARPTNPAGATSPSTATGATARARDTSGAAGTAANAKNQTQSGVTNTKTGTSTLGPGVKKTEPTQGQPVTSKGDTLVRRKKP